MSLIRSIKRFAQILLCLVVLMAIGFLLETFKGKLKREIKERSVSGHRASVTSVQDGLIEGILGGNRALMATFAWIRLNGFWERRQAPEVRAMISLATKFDPDTDFFWINGARMIAYDMPTWQIRAEGGTTVVPEARQQAIDREFAEEAFDLVDRAIKLFPNKSKYLQERGQIALLRLKSDELAIEYFGRAAEKADSAPATARIYANLLRKVGRVSEAYDFLKRTYLSKGNRSSVDDEILLGRIREIENDLEIPVWNRFMPQIITEYE